MISPSSSQRASSALIGAVALLALAACQTTPTPAGYKMTTPIAARRRHPEHAGNLDRHTGAERRFPDHRNRREGL